MDITQLEYFKVIAETGSLTRAAELLHVSQPAMSAMLKKFEEELNVELFDRTPNRIHLNQMGEIALSHANSILQNVENMKSDLLREAGHQMLSIAFCDPGIRWFSVPRFSIAYPEITVSDALYEGKEEAKLLSERVYDLMITPRKIQARGIQSQVFLSDQVFLSVPSDSKLLEYQTISFRDIPAQPLLCPQIGGYFLAQIENIITKNNFPITLVKNDFHITQHLIRTTNFLATISTASMDLRNDGTHRTLIPMNDPELNVTYYIYFLKSRKERVQHFLDWAKNCKDQYNVTTDIR